MRERPYARQYESSYDWPTTHGGWLTWLVFRMPGSLLIWWGYFFPARGDVWASGRRPGNRIVEVIATLAVYGMLAFTALCFAVRR